MTYTEKKTGVEVSAEQIKFGEDDPGGRWVDKTGAEKRGRDSTFAPPASWIVRYPNGFHRVISMLAFPRLFAFSRAAEASTVTFNPEINSGFFIDHKDGYDLLIIVENGVKTGAISFPLGWKLDPGKCAPDMIVLKRLVPSEEETD